ncbi:unnamed protein product [Tuber melanosporum]|uniref:(Perigord truffle) hypothetical protein n=1 Tax=Tuber melanosporum (strain Mel28) TaxID=656061 RepID=D5GQ56_TUBMM|nr:uncharacterized protein GSTUM_00012205001 [Tuber melanosporum]CAZ86649.1 unnamed protein product [Tuber melanosporum]
MGGVASCIRSVFRAIGNTCMAIVNGIAGILKAIINGVASVFDILISCLTCRRSGGFGRRRMRSHHRTYVA